MSIETLIPLVVQHNSLIIQALVSLILFLVMVVAYLNFVRAKKHEEQASHGGGADLGHLEETLKKLLEKADKVPTAAAVHASGGGEETANLVSEIETLRKSLQEKQDQIEALKSAPPVVVAGEAGVSSAPSAAVSAASDEEKAALAKELKDLQAKLSEYEIISEDIADLSRYKDENSKLQAELAALKAGGAASVASVLEAATPEPMAAAAAPTPAELAAAAAAIAPAPVAEAAVAAAPAPPAAEVERPDPSSVLNADDDLIREFADAVNAQAGGAAAATPAPAAPTPAAAQPAAPQPAAPKAQAAAPENLDVLKVEATELDESAASSLFDVERMTAEAGELQASAASAPDVTAEQAIGESLDPEKIAEEAARMMSQKPEDAQLMGEFEDFMKKGNG